MKKTFVFFLVICFVNYSEGQNIDRSYIDSCKRIVEKKYSKIENSIKEFSMKINADTCIKCSELNNAIGDELFSAVSDIKMKDSKKINEKYAALDLLITRIKKSKETSVCINRGEISEDFLSKLYVEIATINVKQKNSFEEYLKKTNLTIFDTPPVLSNQDILTYKVYSGLSYLYQMFSPDNGIDTQNIYRHIDTIGFLTKFISDDTTVSFKKFAKPDVKIINKLIADGVAVYNDYIDAKKADYAKRNRSEQLKLQADNKKRPWVYNYFLYIDSLPSTKK